MNAGIEKRWPSQLHDYSRTTHPALLLRTATIQAHRNGTAYWVGNRKWRHHSCAVGETCQLGVLSVMGMLRQSRIVDRSAKCTAETGEGGGSFWSPESCNSSTRSQKVPDGTGRAGSGEGSRHNTGGAKSYFPIRPLGLPRPVHRSYPRPLKLPE
jgi:hypothetical protein